MASALLPPVASLHRLLSSSPAPSLATPNRSLSIPISTPRSPSSFLPSITNKTHHLPRPLLPKASDQEAAVSVSVKEEEEEEEEKKEDDAGNKSERRRVYIGNLPFGLSASHLEALISQCCPLRRIDMKITRNQKGETNGWAFITVESENDAHSIIEKFNSYVVLDKTIKVEYPRGRTKLTPLSPPVPQEQMQNVYVSNLAWKVRKGDLKEFFANFKPISVRVIYDSLSKKATGYGFVKFATKEEALTAIAELNGKELMGRSLKLKLNEKNEDTSATKQEEPAENAREPALVS